MPQRRTTLLLLVVALAGALLSVLLLLHHYNQAHENALVSMICGGAGKSGCEAVDESAYSAFLGLPLSAFGIVFYAAVALIAGLSLPAGEKAQEAAAAVIFLLALPAFLLDLLLLGLQVFSIGAFCALCLATYIATLLLVLLSWRYRSGAPAKVRGLAAAPAGTLLLSSWGVAIALAAVGVYVANMALAFADPTTFDARLADIAYDEYRAAPQVTIDVADAPTVGPADAPIQIVLFSDFLCPWCKQVAEDFAQNFPKWNDKVAIYYKSFPLDKFCNPSIAATLHPGSCWMALGGVCAAEQGKFWEYHDAVYANQPTNPDGHDALVAAAGAGLDTVAMRACMLQVANQGKVRSLIRQGASLGVTGTPVIYINGRRLPRFAYFTYVLRRESERLGLTLGGLDD